MIVIVEMVWNHVASIHVTRIDQKRIKNLDPTGHSNFSLFGFSYRWGIASRDLTFIYRGGIASLFADRTYHFLLTEPITFCLQLQVGELHHGI